MEFIKKAIKVGNSAGVLLPKKLLGCEVKITVISRPFNLKRVILKLLSPHLQDIIGIYLTNKNPLEVLAVSSSTREKIQDGKLALSIIPLAQVRKDIKENEKLKDKILSAEIILNKSLLDTLKFEAKAKVRTKL